MTFISPHSDRSSTGITAVPILYQVLLLLVNLDDSDSIKRRPTALAMGQLLKLGAFWTIGPWQLRLSGQIRQYERMLADVDGRCGRWDYG